MRYWRTTSVAVKYVIITSICLLFFALLRGGNAHAAPVTDLIPDGTMPQYVEDYLLDCGHTNGASAQYGWLSLENQPTEVVTTVTYGTPSIRLQYNVVGIVCKAGSLGGLSSTNNGVISTSPTDLGLDNTTLTYTYGSVNGSYSIASVAFTYVQTGTFTEDNTEVAISFTEKRINVYSVNPRNRCVTNQGDVNYRVPSSGTDYDACKSEGVPSFSVFVHVVEPSPIVACSIAHIKMFVGQSYTPLATVTHAGPAGAPNATLTGTITVQGQAANSVSGSVANGDSTNLSAPARVFNTAGTYRVRANLLAVSSRPTVSFSCEEDLVVILPPPSATCSVNSPSILAGDSTPLTVTVTNTSPALAPMLNYTATVVIDTKPNQTFNGSIANGGAPVQLTTATLPFGPGRFNVTVTITGNAPTVSCTGTISSFNRPYVRTYSNDVLSGYGFYDNTSSCPTSAGNITTYGRGSAQSYAGSGGQLGSFAKGQIDGFRSASTVGSAATLPELLSFANTALVNTGAGLYGGNYGSGICMYNYWDASARATPLGAQSIDIGSLASGSYYIKQTTGVPVTIIGSISNGKKVVVYVEGTALLRGAAVGYATSTWPTRTDIPSLYIIVKGNLAVGSDVRNLDGHFIAQKSNSSDGRILSCADPATAQPYASSAAQIASCSNKLVVNGSFNAEHVNLLRSFSSVSQAAPGEPAGSSNAAEMFVYPLESYISSQSINTIGQQTYDSITALPPSL